MSWKEGNPGCECCPCNWTFSVTNSCTGAAVSGAVVSAKQSDVEIGNGTTDASGNCTLNVPTGTYDVTVTPPTGSGLATYSDSVAHTCGQATAIGLDVDADHNCLTGCPCKTPPKVMNITFAFSGAYTGFHWPDGPLTFQDTPGGFWDHAWISATFDHNGSPVCLELQCDSAFNQWDLAYTATNTAPIPPQRTPIGGASFGSPATCTPLYNPNGRVNGWSATDASWGLLG